MAEKFRKMGSITYVVMLAVPGSYPDAVAVIVVELAMNVVKKNPVAYV